MEAQGDRNFPEERRGILGDSLEARTTVDNHGDACPPVELQPWGLRNRSAERRDRHYEADLFQKRMTFDRLRLQLPAVGVHIYKVRTQAALLSGERSRHKRERRNDGEWTLRSRSCSGGEDRADERP